MSFRSTLAICFISLLILDNRCDALRCQVMNTIQGITAQDCPAHIFECMKFVCRHGRSEQIYKGCNDPANPPVSYPILQQNCANMGGNGKQYLCRYEFCNSSRATSVIFLITTLLLFKSFV